MQRLLLLERVGEWATGATPVVGVKAQMPTMRRFDVAQANDAMLRFRTLTIGDVEIPVMVARDASLTWIWLNAKLCVDAVTLYSTRMPKVCAALSNQAHHTSRLHNAPLGCSALRTTGFHSLQATTCIEQCDQLKSRSAGAHNSAGGNETGELRGSWAANFNFENPTDCASIVLRAAGRRPFTACRVGCGTVYSTPYGPFDGNSWERLCQLVFKRKFTSDGYTHIPATPGDYGLEGFTKTTGCGFQCYCPDKAYPAKDLYEKQRDKITEDLKKLRTNEVDLKKVLGTTKLRRWHLVTPTIALNDLVKHAQAKEAEVRSWNLSILDLDFQVLLHDADHYATEIQEMQLAVGNALDFGGLATTLPALGNGAEGYEKNVMRKTRARLENRVPADKLGDRVARLYQVTLREFLDHDAHFRRINDTAPTVHSRLVRLVNGYEAHVVETCSTWEGTPQELTEKIRDGLAARIARELAPAIDETGAAQIARLMVSRWIAVCEVDYG